MTNPTGMVANAHHCKSSKSSSCHASATATPAPQIRPCSRALSGWVRWASDAGAMALTQIGQPVAQPRGLVERDAGDRRGRGGRGGVQRDGAEAERPRERPRLDVDELHPAVRHDDEPAEHDAAAYDEVVLVLGVAPA